MADRFIGGAAPIDYGPVLLLMPFGSHLTVDTLPSEAQQSVAPGPPWPVSSFRLRARLDVSIPSAFFGQRGITPAFGYGAPHSSASGTLTLLNNALLSAQYLCSIKVKKKNVPCGWNFSSFVAQLIKRDLVRSPAPCARLPGGCARRLGILLAAVFIASSQRSLSVPKPAKPNRGQVATLVLSDTYRL